MKPHVVLFKVPSQKPCDQPLAIAGYFCDPETEVSNMLCKGHEILWVWEGISVSDAFSDYYGTKKTRTISLE